MPPHGPEARAADHDEQHAALLRMLLGSDGGSELLLQSLI